jgi:TRAP transporter TAXI family solute receptor
LQNYSTPCDEKKMTFMKVSTGSSSGTYIKIGKDLARFVAPDSCVMLQVETSRGSVDNVYKLLSSKFVALAVVQSDVLGRFKELSRESLNPKLRNKAKKIVDRLRLVKPLYMEEVHFIVKKSSLLKKIQDIKDARINIGSNGSGTAMSSILIYKELFGDKIPHDNIFTYNYDRAFRKLMKGDIDVMVMVGGQPISKLKSIPKRFQNKVRFLYYDKELPQQVYSYSITKIKKSSYPWMQSDIQTIGVPSYLVTFNYGRTANKYQKKMKKALARMAFNFKKNVHLLKRCGHKKWKEVDKNLQKPLRGWRYYNVTDFGYKYNPTTCSQRAKDLTLCR